MKTLSLNQSNKSITTIVEVDNTYYGFRNDFGFDIDLVPENNDSYESLENDSYDDCVEFHSSVNCESFLIGDILDNLPEYEEPKHEELPF